ncbi:MAG: peptidoglycan-binding domain-containing protein [Candidatus Paceibacterota bacterium]
MKKIFFLTILLLSSIINTTYAEGDPVDITGSVQSTNNSNYFYFNRNLSVGSAGNDVLVLKKILSSEINISINQTNIFDNTTKEVVKLFQENYSNEILAPSNLIEGTGIVGPATRKKLNELTSKYNILESDYSQITQSQTPVSYNDGVFKNNLKLGSTGIDVILLKIILNNDEYTALPYAKSKEKVSNTFDLNTFIFDFDTFNSVKKFQEKYTSEILTPLGLTESTGIVGAATRNKLNGLIKALNENDVSTTTLKIRQIIKNNYSQTTTAQTSKVRYLNDNTNTYNTNKTYYTNNTIIKNTSSNLPATKESLASQYGNISFLSTSLNSNTNINTIIDNANINQNTISTNQVTVQSSGKWLSNLKEAKTIAYRNNQYLIVQVGNYATCGYTKKPNNTIFTTDIWKNYVKEKGLGLFFAKVENSSMDSIRTELRKYHTGDYPYYLVFKVLSEASLSTNSMGLTDVKYIGSFMYRRGKKVNGISASMTANNFIQILETYTK